MKVAVSCQLGQDNQRDFVRTISGAEELNIGVITDSRNYRDVDFIDQSDIYHISPILPDSTAAIREFHPLIRRQYRLTLNELDPDILLSLGASRLLFVGLSTGFEPTVHLPQGGELSKAVGNIYWDEGWFKRLRYRLLYRPIYQKLLQNVAETWAPGATENKTEFKCLGLPPEKFRGFDWSIADTEMFTQQPDAVSFADDKTTVIGSFRRIRGSLLEQAYREFLDAIGQLAERRNDFHVVLGGFYPDGQSEPIQSMVEAKIAEYDLDKVVTCLELVPKADLPRYLSGLDVYMNLSHRDLTLNGIGTAAKEGMACECALVTYNEPDVSYVVDDGINGVLVPYNDVDSIVDNLETLCQDEHYREQLAKRGRKTVVNKFSPKIIREQVVKYCREILTDQKALSG